ncbi:MAG: RNA-binding S4 domain-containing protein [Granulosicoccus sp.]|nr:RNA-binding S4 domain-containing protein [Granulosicoccus sp.]
MVMETRTVQINQEPVELYRILKFEGLVDSGGAAKQVIGAGEVLFNGVVETRKRKKVVSGDQIEFAGILLLIELET